MACEQQFSHRDDLTMAKWFTIAHSNTNEHGCTYKVQTKPLPILSSSTFFHYKVGK